MVSIIKRGGFREQAARQLKYKNSVNQRTDIKQQKPYQPAASSTENNPLAVEPESIDQTNAENVAPTDFSSSNKTFNKEN